MKTHTPRKPLRTEELFDAALAFRERAEKAEAEVKEIRAALGDDGRRTHKEILELAFKASAWKTWKEKYTDLKNAHIAEGQDPAGTIWEHADKLQNELKAYKNTVDRLKEKLVQAVEICGLMANHVGGPIKKPVPDIIKSLAEDVLNLHKPDKQPATEWRDLGPGEVIQDGDELLCDKGWLPCRMLVGNKRRNDEKPQLTIRTRRPWPKQEES
jgi:hypothetical protein